MLVHLSLFVLFQGVETSDTCVGTPQSVCVVSGSCDVRQVCWYTSVCFCCLFHGVETSYTCVGTPQYVCVGCFIELSRQARVLGHLSLFLLDVS